MAETTSPRLKTTGLGAGIEYEQEQQEDHSIGEAITFGHLIQENFAGVSGEDAAFLKVAHADLEGLYNESPENLQKLLEVAKRNKNKWGINKKITEDVIRHADIALKTSRALESNKFYTETSSQIEKKAIKSAEIAKQYLKRYIPDKQLDQIRANLPKGAPDPLTEAAVKICNGEVSSDAVLKQFAEKGIPIPGKGISIELSAQDKKTILKELPEVTPVIDKVIQQEETASTVSLPSTPTQNATTGAAVVQPGTPAQTATTTQKQTAPSLSPSEKFIKDVNEELAQMEEAAQKELGKLNQESHEKRDQKKLNSLRTEVASIKEFKEDLKKPGAQKWIGGLSQKRKTELMQNLNQLHIRAFTAKATHEDLYRHKKFFNRSLSNRLLNFRVQKSTFTPVGDFLKTNTLNLRDRFRSLLFDKSGAFRFRLPHFTIPKISFSNLARNFKTFLGGFRSFFNFANLSRLLSGFFHGLTSAITGLAGSALNFLKNRLLDIAGGLISGGVLPLLGKGWDLLKRFIPGLDRFVKGLHINEFLGALFCIGVVLLLFVVGYVITIFFRNSSLACPLSLPEPFKQKCGELVIQYVIR